jgi:DNA-binding protein HU-beta
MNKSELVDAMATAADISKAAAARALDAFVESVVGAVAKGEAVALVGFGTFDVSERAARTGRNPQTGAAMQIPAAKLPRFKAGKTFKETVKNQKAKK